MLALCYSGSCKFFPRGCWLARPEQYSAHDTCSSGGFWTLHWSGEIACQLSWLLQLKASAAFAHLWAVMCSCRGVSWKHWPALNRPESTLGWRWAAVCRSVILCLPGRLAALLQKLTKPFKKRHLNSCLISIALLPCYWFLLTLSYHLSVHFQLNWQVNCKTGLCMYIYTHICEQVYIGIHEHTYISF